MKVQIIAELAQGFEGDASQAKLLLRAAIAANANAAKFQLIIADELATPDYKYYELFRSLEMSEYDWLNLASYAKKNNIEFHVDIFGSHSLELAKKIGASAIKLHGTDITNIGLIDQVAKSPIKKIFIGAGGAYLSEIDEVVSRLSSKDLVIILGFQSYPTPNEANQINRIHFLKKYFKDYGKQVSFGFADHASPNSPLRYAIAATALGAGAVAIEKHLTLGRVAKLEDYESALNPDEFKVFVDTIKDCDLALGNMNEFFISQSEENYRNAIRRHVVSSRNLPQGTILSPSDLTLKRTSALDPITDLRQVYKKAVISALDANSPILKSDIN